MGWLKHDRTDDAADSRSVNGFLDVQKLSALFCDGTDGLIAVPSASGHCPVGTIDQ